MNPDEPKVSTPVQRPNEKALTTSKANGLRLYPCDGVKRYKVKGSREPLLSYSEAYEALFVSTGGARDKEHRTFSREGIRRISALNDAYLKVAYAFVVTTIAVENQMIADALEKAKAIPPMSVETKLSSRADLSVSHQPEPESENEIQTDRTTADSVS